MAVLFDSIGSQDLAAHVEARDLLAPIFGEGEGLEGTDANCIETGERLAGAIEASFLPDSPAARHDIVEAAQCWRV